MRHHNANRKFGRKTDERRALLRSLAEGLMGHGKIMTTEAKAKELRPYVEKLITVGRKATVTATRYLISELGSVARARKLQNDVAPKYKDRAGGYTRIVKVPRRIVDGSKMAIIELV